MNKNTSKDAYDKFASRYHKMRGDKSNFWNQYIEAPAMEKLLKPIVNNKIVLDLGCGSGISTAKFVDWGANVIGSDISEEMIKIAREYLPNVQFDVADAEKTPYDKDTFNIVASSLTLHYLENLDFVMKEVARILKPQGVFVFSMNHPFFMNKKTVEYKGKKEYILKPYFHNDQYKWGMFDKKMVLVSYHHTFEDIFSNLKNNNFVVQNLLETRPIKEGKKLDPKGYEKTSKYPTFLVIKAKLA